MSELVHGTITLPTGLTITGTLVHKLTTQTTERSIESLGTNGRFSHGKNIANEIKYTVSGDTLDDAAFPAVGSGDKSDESPHITDLKLENSAEAAQTFELNAVVEVDGEGAYPAAEAP